jgi:hypothetical protein
MGWGLFKINIMKFESINSSKFEGFKQNELLSKINIVGGTKYESTNAAGQKDLLDDTTAKIKTSAGGFDDITPK